MVLTVVLKKKGCVKSFKVIFFMETFQYHLGVHLNWLGAKSLLIYSGDFRREVLCALN